MEREAGDLKIYHAQDLDFHIEWMDNKILEFADKYNGNVTVTFSGGIDSTLLLHRVRAVLGDHIPGIFVNTGLEYNEIVKFVKTFDNIIWLRPKVTFRQVTQKYGFPVISKKQAQFISEIQERTGKNEATRRLRLTGYTSAGLHSPMSMISKKHQYLVDAPFKVSDKCCDVMKKEPFNRYQKATGSGMINGNMADDSQTRRRTWITHGCNAFELGKSSPMSIMNRQHVLEYIVRFGLPFCSVYGEIRTGEDGYLYNTGVDRTGCVFCLFGMHMEKPPNRMQQMAISHPKLHLCGLNRFGLKQVLDLCGLDYYPDDHCGPLFKQAAR